MISIHFVILLVYPIVLTPPNDETVLQGRNVRFDCEVDGRPFPKTSWLFKNQTISTNHSKLLSNGSLFLSSVQNNAEYEGDYSCFAKNEAGRSEKSSGFLIVHGTLTGVSALRNAAQISLDCALLV